MKKSLILSLGSNLGDRQMNIDKAYDLIEQSIGRIIQKSSYYENKAIGFESETLFLNTCIEVETSLEPLELLSLTQSIEKEIGRTKKTEETVYQSRLIDIDIILLDDLIHSSENLTIPHKLYRNRLFVLKPLSEIAKNRLDPVLHLTVCQLVVLV